MKNNIQRIQQTIYKSLNEISVEVGSIPQEAKAIRDTRLHRIVSSKLQRAKEGTRFLY